MAIKTITVLIFTPMDLEFKAAIRHLAGPRATIFEDEMAYEKGRFQGKYHDYTVIVCETGMKNTDMALAVEKAVKRFQPQIALLIGVAGGIKDVKVGDVVVATSAFNYESGKEIAAGQFLPRPAEYPFSKDLRARVQAVSRSDNWKARTRDGAAEADIVLGPIAAGDKVVAAAQTVAFERLQQFLSHVKAVEMEAAGFGLAIQSYRDLHAIAIRGISDMCQGKNEGDDRNWQPIAADRAAAVGFEMLGEMEASFIKDQEIMDIKTLAKEIFALLFPLPESFKEIGDDFKKAANNEVRLLWQKVKPLFIEEINELAKDPEDAALKGAAEIKIRKALEADSGLKETVEEMVGKAKATSKTSISVVNSKNVVAGSVITVGGDFRLGDGN